MPPNLASCQKLTTYNKNIHTFCRTQKSNSIQLSSYQLVFPLLESHDEQVHCYRGSKDKCLDKLALVISREQPRSSTSPVLLNNNALSSTQAAAQRVRTRLLNIFILRDTRNSVPRNICFYIISRWFWVERCRQQSWRREPLGYFYCFSLSWLLARFLPPSVHRISSN